jgi:hypothetical protein
MVRVKSEELANYSSYDYDYFVLPDNGDSAEVRFMYPTVDELLIADSVHNAKFTSGKGKEYEKMVDCLRVFNDPVEKCPLCHAGLKPTQKAVLQLYVISMTINGKTQEVNKPAVWNRPRSIFTKLEISMKRIQDPLVGNIFEITRAGKAKDTNTDYLITFLEKDETTLEELPEVVERSKIILEKSFEDLQYYVQEGEFPDEEKEQTQTSRRSSGRTMPANEGNVRTRARGTENTSGF